MPHTKYDRREHGLIGHLSPERQMEVQDRLNQATDRLQEALDLAQRMFDELDAAYDEVLEGTLKFSLS